MTRKVYAYQSLINLREHPAWSEIARAPHITATGYLAGAVRDGFSEIRNVMNIQELLSDMASFWGSRETVFRQFITLSRIIRETENPEGGEALRESFRKNKSQVLAAARALAEANVFPDEIVPEDDEEKLFYRIWYDLEEQEPSFERFRQRLDQMETSRAVFEKSTDAEARGLDTDTVVLHGFYYITPMQERLFDIFEAQGKTLVFLSHIDSEVAAANEIWQSTFTSEDGFPQKDEWVFGYEKHAANRHFSELFDGKAPHDGIAGARIIKYRNETEFISDFERLRKERFTVLSTDVARTDELLKMFYPENFRRRHLLSYPAGQYIWCLHAMWNGSAGQIEMDSDMLSACFASGWLENNGENAKAYLSDLEMVKTYVSDCRTPEEWRKRLELLLESEEQTRKAFEGPLERLSGEVSREHRIMANPMLNFSCFSADRNRLEKLAGFVDGIAQTAEFLFSENGETDIAGHMKKINELLKEGNELDLLDEEKAVISEISERLASDRQMEGACLPEDIADAIMIAIGGGILDEENEITGDFDMQIVKPIYQAEGAALKTDGRVHLCLADDSRLPGGKRDYPWPVTRKMLENLDMAQPEKYYRYVQDMINTAENMTLAKRYLMFTLLENSYVEFSWIEEEDGKTLGMSPYLAVLADALSVPVEEYDRKTTPGKGDMKRRFIPSRSPENLLQERRADALLCGWKEFYGYELDDHPSYRSDFHYGFVMSKLIGVTANLTGISKHEVAEELSAVFRYPRGVEMRQIEDYSGCEMLSGSDAAGDASFTENRMHVHLAHRSIYDMYLERRDDYEQGNVLMDPDRRICMYCQFAEDCPHAITGGAV